MQHLGRQTADGSCLNSRKTHYPCQDAAGHLRHAGARKQDFISSTCIWNWSGSVDILRKRTGLFVARECWEPPWNSGPFQGRVPDPHRQTAFRPPKNSDLGWRSAFSAAITAFLSPRALAPEVISGTFSVAYDARNSLIVAYLALKGRFPRECELSASMPTEPPVLKLFRASTR